MKRLIETSGGDTSNDCTFVDYFENDFALDALLDACPWPWLLGCLLRLSKEMRRRLWEWLTDNVKVSHEWVHELGRRLTRYSERKPPSDREYSCLHPVFFLVEPALCFPVSDDTAAVRSEKDRYYVAQLLVPRRVVGLQDVLIADKFRHSAQENGRGSTSWYLLRDRPLHHALHWYFVASALQLCYHRSWLHYAQKRTSTPVVTHDRALLVL